jgi:hypothetical protein
LPGWPPLFYAVAESLACVGAIWLFIRYRSELRESVLLLALLPLVVAFRSPANYFAVMPWLTLYAMLMLNRRRVTTAAQPGVPAHIPISPATSAR